jgi:NAD-dependent dihydropyrimidine dehydrogenase PreA subunit
VSALSYFGLNLLASFLRFFPMRGHVGLIRIGRPGRGSPVLLTGNFRLTVARVKRALEGTDAWLLVADSRGINVWCAAGGGHLTNHSVIAVLKTSGILDLVDHRILILPQLAASGIEAREIKAKTGWTVKWGPVYAADIPAFLAAGKKTERMKQIRFPLKDRLEMAAAWALPLSLMLGIPLYLIKRPLAAPLLALIWIFSAALYLLFPLYRRWLKPRKGVFGFAVQYAFPLILWAVFAGGLLVIDLSGAVAERSRLLQWGGMALGVVLLLGFEIRGTTPLFPSSFQKGLGVRLDEDLCRGAGFCSDVCPRVGFMVEEGARKARLNHEDDCLQCGACVVQCPFDALYLVGPDGGKIPPSTIRTYKINLLGKRTVG